MDFVMVLRTSWRSIVANKMRSVLTALGIIIGVASVILMVAISQGATAGITERLTSMGTNILTIMPSGGRGAMRGFGGGQLTIGDMEAIKQLPYVKRVSPENSTNATVASGSLSWQATIDGTTPEMQNLRGWEMAAGTFFSDDDVDNMSMVAVLGQTVVENLYHSGNPVGSEIKINGLTFTVVGVLPSLGGGMGGDPDNTVYIPLTTAQKRLTGSQNLSRLTVQASDKDALNFLKDTITALLRQRHRLADSADDDFRIMDMAQLLETVEDTSRILSLLLGGIAAVSLVVGGIGVMNIMLVSVTERTKEIGIRMAVGARTRDILAQFLVESMLLCIIGGVIGSVLGYSLAFVFGKLTSWRMMVPAWSVILATGFSLAVGVVFGYYPAKKAAESDPIEALRYE